MAKSISTLPMSTPVTTRLGIPKGFGATNAWTSTSKGLCPSIMAATIVPATGSFLCDNNHSDGLGTSVKPFSSN
jgi:hypothetical protein